MSQENHPNFHAVKFTTTITSELFECLRGKATVLNCPNLAQEIVEFVSKIETIIDASVEDK